MCANFKPVTPCHIKQLNLEIPDFCYKDDIYPSDDCPLLFSNEQGIQWRNVKFGIVPPWAEDLKVTRHTYNARTESVAQKPSFQRAWQRNQFALIPVDLFYEPRYINGKAERWGIFRKDKKPFTIAAIYENTRLNGEQIRSMSMLTIDAQKHEFMQQFHKPEDTKRSIIVIPEAHRKDWLNCHHSQAHHFFFELNDEFTTAPMPRHKPIVTNPQGSLF